VAGRAVSRGRRTGRPAWRGPSSSIEHSPSRGGDRGPGPGRRSWRCGTPCQGPVRTAERRPRAGDASQGWEWGREAPGYQLRGDWPGVRTDGFWVVAQLERLTHFQTANRTPEFLGRTAGAARRHSSTQLIGVAPEEHPRAYVIDLASRHGGFAQLDALSFSFLAARAFRRSALAALASGALVLLKRSLSRTALPDRSRR
jgi:hypothetical protein